jgi:hypothetical protein
MFGSLPFGFKPFADTRVNLAVSLTAAQTLAALGQAATGEHAVVSIDSTGQQTLHPEYFTYTNGNLTVERLLADDSTLASAVAIRGRTPNTTTDYYWEVKIDAVYSGGDSIYFGMMDVTGPDGTNASNVYPGRGGVGGNGCSIRSSGEYEGYEGDITFGAITTGTGFAAGDTIGILQKANSNAGTWMGWDFANSHSTWIKAGSALARGDTNAGATLNTTLRANSGIATNGYFEIVCHDVTTGVSMIGLCNASQSNNSNLNTANAIAYCTDGTLKGSQTGTGGATFTQYSDTIGVMYTGSSVKFYKNGVLQYTATTLPSGSLVPAVSNGEAWFGVWALFAGTATSGFKNLPASAVDAGTDFGVIEFYKNGTKIRTSKAPPGRAFPSITFNHNTTVKDKATANFGATALSYQPASSTSWDGSTVVGSGPSAVVNQTLGALTQALTGSVIDTATVNQALGALGQAATGTVSNAAIVAQTLGALTQVATDAVLAQATTTQTLGALGQAATATAIDTATVAQTLGALSQVAAGTVADAITVAQNLGALTQAAAATHPDTVAVAQTLGALVQAATGGVIDAATAAQTLGALGQAATATAPAALTAAQTLGAIGQTSAGTAIVSAVASQTLGALAQAATGTVTDAATVAQALGALSQTTTGGPVDSASVAQTLGALTQAATATLTDARNAAAAQTLGDLGQALTGAVVDTATVSQSLGPLSQTVTATATDTASVAQTLGAIVQAMTGAVIDTAAVNQALGALNQTATAATTSGFVAAQTLSGLVQALTGTVVSHATIAQALGGLGQTTSGGPVARIGAYTDALGPLGQVTTAGHVSFANVAQVLGALSQTATAQGPGPANFAANQILAGLQQVAASNAPERILATQVLAALGQAVALRITPVAGVAIHGSMVKLRQGFGSLGQRTFLAGSVTSRPTLSGHSRVRKILSGSTR